MSACGYCDEEDTSDDPTTLYIAADGSRMYLHPSCFVDMQEQGSHGDDEEPLKAWAVAKGPPS